MNSSTRTRDIESNPAPTRSVSLVNSTFGAKTSRRRNPSRSVSICWASIALRHRGDSPNLAGGQSAWQGTDHVQPGRNFEGRQTRAAKIADRLDICFRLVEHEIRFDHFSQVRMEP